MNSRRRLKSGEPVPDFTMTSQDGKAVKLSDLRGNVVVLTFIYTRCPLPDFCPADGQKVLRAGAAARRFPRAKAKDVRLISLSFDPEHDTPELLRKHAQVRGAIPPLWTFAVASHAELAKIACALGLFFSPDDSEIAHNLCTAIIDPAGKLARLEVGTEEQIIGTRPTFRRRSTRCSAAAAGSMSKPARRRPGVPCCNVSCYAYVWDVRSARRGDPRHARMDGLLEQV